MKMKKSEIRFLISQNEFLILASLVGGTKHGYAIGKDVLDVSGGKVRFSAATLYENLSRMLDAGFIERADEKDVEAEKRRKLYRVTGLGSRVLSEQWTLLQRAGGRIPQPGGAPTVGQVPAYGG